MGIDQHRFTRRDVAHSFEAQHI
ncbi:MAG: hypothetical protein RLZZ604_1284, partial [Pseudomonadota bacterium]